jgi:hypothetical protein
VPRSPRSAPPSSSPGAGADARGARAVRRGRRPDPSAADPSVAAGRRLLRRTPSSAGSSGTAARTP